MIGLTFFMCLYNSECNFNSDNDEQPGFDLASSSMILNWAFPFLCVCLNVRTCCQAMTTRAAPQRWGPWHSKAALLFFAAIASVIKYYVENYLRHWFDRRATLVVGDADEDDTSSTVPPWVSRSRTRLTARVIILQQETRAPKSASGRCTRTKNWATIFHVASGPAYFR